MSPHGAYRGAYAAEVRRCQQLDMGCVHGVPAGDLVRPWTGTPLCALCRRRHPVHWRTLGEPPRPANVVPLHGDRKLW
jgi:hypothetical protein